MTVPSADSAAPNDPGPSGPGNPEVGSTEPVNREPVNPEPVNPSADRIWTIPNALSVLRLLGVPLFLWLILQPVFHGPRYDGWALLVLAVGGFTDYLDGKLARALGQVSRFGALLDPAADRLYILATLAGLAARQIIPVWLVVLLVGRDVLMAIPLLVLRRHGFGPPPVHYLGKAATFNLLYAFPLLLLGDGTGWLHDLAGTVGWAFAIWGTAMYWLAAGLYVVQVRRLTSTGGAEPH